MWPQKGKQQLCTDCRRCRWQGDLLLFYRKAEHFTVVEKTINLFCSEQQADTAAKMQHWQAPRMSGFPATWPPNLWCICALKAFSPFKCSFWYHVSETHAHPFEPDFLRPPGSLWLQPCLITAHCGLQVEETDVFWGTLSSHNKTQTTKHSVPEIAALIRRQSNLTLKGNVVVFLVSLDLKSFFGPCWSLNACSQRCALC